MPIWRAVGVSIQSAPLLGKKAVWQAWSSSHWQTLASRAALSPVYLPLSQRESAVAPHPIRLAASAWDRHCWAWRCGVCAKAEQPCPFGIGERIKAQRRGGNLAGAPKMGRPRPQNRGAKTLHLVRKHGRNRTGCARDLRATQGGLKKKEWQW